MKKKRRPPISKSLQKNSLAAILAAIEIHNKPIFTYRYEVVVLLIINSWELLIKSYLYKFTNSKIIEKDGTSKPFKDCLNAVESNLGNSFLPIKENLGLLYFYRNEIAHFYSEKLDLLIYSLIRKSLTFYVEFLKTHFKIDISENLDLVITPIGFKKFFSPLDFITNQSAIRDSSSEVKVFIKRIIDVSKKLDGLGINDPVIVDFKLNLSNVNRIKNADIVAGVDNTENQQTTFSVTKKSSTVKVVGDSSDQIRVTRNKQESQGVLLYEELSEGIFDEINNIIEANNILAKESSKFMLGQSMYYRIYAERQYVNFNMTTFEMLAKEGLTSFYGPSLYWLTKLSADKIIEILNDLLNQAKSPYITNLIKLSILLGEEVTEYYFAKIENIYGNMTQAPQFYYSFKELIKYRRSNLILKALKSNSQKKPKIDSFDYSYGEVLNNPQIGINPLSNLCLKIYNGDVKKRSVARDLDYLSYGAVIQQKSENITSKLILNK